MSLDKASQQCINDQVSTMHFQPILKKEQKTTTVPKRGVDLTVLHIPRAQKMRKQYKLSDLCLCVYQII